MSGLRWASRADGNQTRIVSELRALGYTVDIVHREKRLYDLVVSGLPTWASRDVSVRVECKTAKGRMSTDELEYRRTERHGGSLITAQTAEDVLRWFGLEAR